MTLTAEYAQLYMHPPPRPARMPASVLAPAPIRAISRWAHGCTGRHDIDWNTMFLLTEVIW